MHPRAAQGAPTHPAGLGKVAGSPEPEYPEPKKRAPSPEPEPEPEPEPAGAEDEISAESGDYAAQFQAKFFAA